MRNVNLRRIAWLLLAALLAAGCGDKQSGGTADPGADSTKTATTAASRKVLVLAIDGGGIRGIIPATILTELELKLGKACFQTFDVIGGTSTGGILSIGLTTKSTKTPSTPFTAQQLLDIYSTEGAKIFVKQSCSFKHCAPYYADDGNGNGIEPYLRTIVGSSTNLSNGYNYMSTLPNARTRQMFTTTYTVNSKGKTVTAPKVGVDYGPYLFNWQDAMASPADNYYLWEAARGTSAAPTYFPVAHVGGGSSPRSGASERWVVDGGVMSNDPAIWGVSEALRTGLATSLADIVVVSLGTGIYPGDAGIGIHTNYAGLTPDDGNWNYMPWLVESMYNLEGVKNERGSVVDVINYSVQMAPQLQMRGFQAAGLTYYRLEPVIPESLAAMDNVSPENINALKAAARGYLAGPGTEIFRTVVATLKAN